MRLTTSFKLMVIFLHLLVLAGCAQNNVTETAEVSYSGLKRPNQVLIYDFAVSPQDVKENSSIFAQLARNIGDSNQTDEEIQLGRETADALSEELFKKIAAMGLTPVHAERSTPLPAGSIAITGQFVNIDEGNRLRRNVIGLGFGKSSIDSNVSVLAPSRSGYRTLIAFDAHADSGDMPGAAVMGPAGAAAGAGTAAVVATNVAVGGIKTYRSASAQQAKGMAEKIAAQLSDYFTRQGWLYLAP